MLLAGVDGCSAGWLCATVDLPAGGVHAATYPDASTLLDTARADVVAVDIPIGLPGAQGRSCDRAARTLLGARASSVFPAPVRAALDAETYDDACDLSARVSGKRLSKQTYAILRKIREFDAAVREGRGSIYEVHPEVSFCIWNGGTPMRHPKTSGFGFVERYRLCEQLFGDAADRIRDQLARSAASDDDILDALAALWTAKRIHARCAQLVAGSGQRDECGLLMEIFA